MYTCITKNDQGGSAANLYENVWGKVLSLPDSTQLYPAHDYKGWFRIIPKKLTVYVAFSPAFYYKGLFELTEGKFKFLYF